ncbi:MAG TPA: PDZ domain-containing protein [Pirellulales bacterium]|jgi:membrane-associated protease RseP (regulator of RpoE activity)|nr:PDZ domain-containing protein [Pirellulales bacterium]
MNRKLIVGLMFAAIGAYGAVAVGQEREGSSASNRQRGDQSDRSQGAFLGVLVTPVHPSLAAHLRNQLSNGQGLIVEDVMARSPAEKAGLREGDILTTFDDQRLFSPEQLMSLVNADKPDRQVSLGIIRNGEAQKVTATLGEQLHYRGLPNGRTSWRAYSRRPQNNRNNDVESFDALSITRVGKDKFKAEVAYRDTQGKVEKRQFEGSREEIRDAIEKQNDLPDMERHQLLAGLGIADEPADEWFEFPPAFWQGPPDARWFDNGQRF